jgi:hypothetical protein
MGPLTRRHALHGAVALLAGLTGCSGSASMSGSSTSTAAAPGHPGDSETSPDHYMLRGATTEPLVRTSTGETDGTNDDRPEERRWRHQLVASADAANSLTVADVDGAAGARAFLDDTNFETETIYVEERAIGECWQLELCHVQWGSERVETDYGRRLRPVDAACSADEKVAVATFIRIPASLDPDAIHQYGSGMSGSGCRPAGDGPRAVAEANATEEN